MSFIVTSRLFLLPLSPRNSELLDSVLLFMIAGQNTISIMSKRKKKSEELAFGMQRLAINPMVRWEGRLKKIRNERS